MTVSDCTIDHDSAQAGGGIYNAGDYGHRLHHRLRLDTHRLRMLRRRDLQRGHVDRLRLHHRPRLGPSWRRDLQRGHVDRLRLHHRPRLGPSWRQRHLQHGHADGDRLHHRTRLGPAGQRRGRRHLQRRQATITNCMLENDSAAFAAASTTTTTARRRPSPTPYSRTTRPGAAAGSPATGPGDRLRLDPRLQLGPRRRWWRDQQRGAR